MKTLEELRQKILANPQAARLLVATSAHDPDPRRKMSFLWQQASSLSRCLEDAARLTDAQANAKIAADAAKSRAERAAYDAAVSASYEERQQLCAPGSILDSVFAAAKEAA